MAVRGLASGRCGCSTRITCFTFDFFSFDISFSGLRRLSIALLSHFLIVIVLFVFAVFLRSICCIVFLRFVCSGCGLLILTHKLLLQRLPFTLCHPTFKVLIQDFNCAYQESFLLQGHMYLFVHYVCFYSNIFGFETKKIIPFHEIMDVKRAKTAGIFSNAIEIFAGGKKFFFASFLSRDEALKLIIDGWLQHGNGSNLITEQQDSISVSSDLDNGIDVIEKVNNFKQASELDSPDRQKATAPSPDSKISASVENGSLSNTDTGRLATK